MLDNHKAVRQVLSDNDAIHTIIMQVKNKINECLIHEQRAIEGRLQFKKLCESSVQEVGHS